MLFWIGIALYVIAALPLCMIIGGVIRRGMHKEDDDDYMIGDDDSDWGDKS